LTGIELEVVLINHWLYNYYS